ncbi:hypothetical protein B0H13DRAFT_2301101 [Mycena leptocephala]|nr:hypothetical protein B0H13DRAFT_2301101 [Mycena leptocephala]
MTGMVRAGGIPSESATTLLRGCLDTFGHSSAAAHTKASTGNGSWSGTRNSERISVWKRSLLGFATAEIWVNNRISEANIDDRCVQLTLDWLQTLVEDGFDWNGFEMVNTA